MRAVRDSERTRSRLIELERRMRDASLFDDEYWRLRPERARLRAAIDVRWLDEHRFGTRCERASPLPWPDDVRLRWRVLRELIEAYFDVTLGDAIDRPYSGCLVESLPRSMQHRIGASLSQWLALVSELVERRPWGGVIRDAPRFEWVDEHRGHFSLLFQWEDDYAWTIRVSDSHEDDPPVFGWRKHDEFSELVRDFGVPYGGGYGSHRSLSDFARAYLDGYIRGPIGRPHRRLREVLGPEEQTFHVRDDDESLPGVWATPIRRRVPECEEPVIRARDVVLRTLGETALEYDDPIELDELALRELLDEVCAEAEVELDEAFVPTTPHALLAEVDRAAQKRG